MRKIKLMALLLAALMVMSAFAGCASGVKDDVADLNDRIGAIEDKLDGLGDNKDVLDAIESMGKDLNDKIDDLNDRVEKVETPAEGEATPEAVAAAQVKALATIKVKSAEFAKAEESYTAEDYVKILEAFGAAEAAVNAAATEAEVAAAVAALDAALENYMTYAMKMYDYYTKLLGNLVDDEDEAMAALVEEIAEFIEVVDEIYKDAEDGVAVALAYKVDDKQTLNVYKSVKALCDIFAGDKATFDYVNAKGKVVPFTAEGLDYYIAEAKALVKAIDKAIGDEIVYSTTYGALDTCIEDYKAYVAAAEIIGGDALVALVTNGDKLVEAEEVIKVLADAAEAFDDYAGYDASARKYLGIADMIPDSIALAEKVDGELVLVIDEYKEFAELLADWADEYDVSDANVEAIFNAKADVDYEEYVAAAKLVEYKTAAYDKFVAEVVPAIAALSKSAKEDAASGVKYGEIYELIEKTIVVLDKYEDMSDVDELLISALGAPVLLTKDEFKDMVAMADVFANAKDAEAAYAAFVAEFDAAADIADASVYSVYLYTFAEKNADALVDFFTDELADIYDAADDINDEIEALAKKVASNSEVSIKAFIELSGEYVNLKNLKATGEFKPKNGDKITLSDVEGDWYVLAADVDMDEFEAAAVAGIDTIAGFNAKYEGFEALINVADFAAAKKALEDKIDGLFADFDGIVADLAPFAYVAGATYWADANKNGKYDAGEEVAAPTYTISLDKANDVKAVKNAFNAWILAGGHDNLENFVEVAYDENKTYGNVYMFDAITVDGGIVDLIYNLDAQIVALNALENAFVKTVNNIVASKTLADYIVNADVNFVALPAEIADADVYKYYAITKFVATTDTKDNAKNGTYTFATAASNGGTYTKDKAVTTSDGALASKMSGVTTRAQIIEAAIAAYDAYVANNNVFAVVEKDGAYTVEVKAADNSDAVKTALDAYAGYEFLYAKGYILANYATGADNNAMTLKATALAAKDLVQLANAINRYNRVSESKIPALNLINELVLADVE